MEEGESCLFLFCWNLSSKTFSQSAFVPARHEFSFFIFPFIKLCPLSFSLVRNTLPFVIRVGRCNGVFREVEKCECDVSFSSVSLFESVLSLVVIPISFVFFVGSRYFWGRGCFRGAITSRKGWLKCDRKQEKMPIHFERSERRQFSTAITTTTSSWGTGIAGDQLAYTCSRRARCSVQQGSHARDGQFRRLTIELAGSPKPLTASNVQL